MTARAEILVDSPEGEESRCEEQGRRPVRRTAPTQPQREGRQDDGGGGLVELGRMDRG